jgi:serine/threonine protein kinase
LATGVKYLHDIGIIHRDLKLENIMMSDTSDTAIPKIVDFGLATFLGPD